MNDVTFSQNLKTLVGLFDVNAGLADELPAYIAKLSEQELLALKAEYEDRLMTGHLNAAEFRNATACSAKDEDSATRFFTDVHKYAFEGGEEPDVTDYWNRQRT